MKHFVCTRHAAGTALAAVAALVGAALLAGKDDIRKFRQMQNM